MRPARSPRRGALLNHRRMRVEATVSPQFDVCFALADICSPNPHFAGWPGLEGSPDWVAQARSFGWVFWLGLPDLVELERPSASTEEFVSALRAVAPSEIVPRLHRSLVQQPTSRFASAQVRQWLHFIGFDDGAPDPSWAARWDEPMDAPLTVLNAFRPHFEKVWAALLPELTENSAQAAKLAGGSDLPSLASSLELGVEFDEHAGVMRTARGYKLPLEDVGAMFLLPSVFNSRRLKT